MILRSILQDIRNLSSLKLSKKSARTMDKCFFRYMEKEDQINVTFLYKVNEKSIRQFNLNRKPTETLNALLSRISANVSKIVQKKAKKNKEAPSDIEVMIFEKGCPLPQEVKCSELLSKFDQLKLQVNDQEFKIIINAPWILNVSLPQSILVGFPVYPLNYETMYSKFENSTFTWYHGEGINNKGNAISDIDIKWNIVGDGFVYTPNINDIGLKLKLECIPGNQHMEGPSVEAISTVCVEAGPGRCPFENRQAFTQNRLSGKSFRVVSYNILADLYCDSDFTRNVLHPYCPTYALHIDYRKQLIIKELLGYNADIACLQEVDCKIFKNTLSPIMSTQSMDGVFTKKGKEVAEGLACFFRTDRFKLISKGEIVFSEHLNTMPCFKPIWEKVIDNNALKDRVLNRSTAGQATVLQSLDNPKEILIVGNTHLYFHPDADHIRLLQGGMMIYWLSDVIRNTREKFPECRVSLLVCGDFNSVPSCGIYKLYTTGSAPSDLEDWKSKEDEKVVGLSLSQNIPLASACGTPEFTNFTAGFADCLDYIYFDTRHIDVEQVIPFPSTEELKEHTALPSVVFPSDHIAQIADLGFK